VDDAYWYEAGSIVPPRKSASYRVSLVFGPPGAAAQELCSDAYDRYAKDHPMSLKWPDRRPIATAFLCNSATGWKTNPRGYFQDSRVEVTTGDGVKAFGERLMKYADICITNMNKMDAQGIIVWDLEGQEMPHMISYIGDPRQLAKLSPEMDRFADAFMKKFRDAGFRTGITIRPTEAYQPNVAGQLPWNQREVEDPVATMSAKIKYAQKRWGCTIFYLDSSVFGDGLLTEAQKKEMHGIPWVMPAGMLEKLTKRHPDCLIAPEFAGRDLYRFGAPYSSPNLGEGGTDPLIRRLWPQAFRLIMSRQDLMEKRWEQYADSVEKGDVLMFCCWGDFAEQAFVKLLYREAAIRKGGALTALAAADDATLAEKAGDSSEATRYAAATALGKTHSPGAISVLAGLLQDESPLVRKQALAGLARADKIEDPACLGVLGEWIKGSKDPVQNALRSQAAEAFAKGGEAVVPGLVSLLTDDKSAGVWPYAVRALGRTATTNANAGRILMGFLDDKAPAKARLRNDVIESLGLLKAKEAVPVLLPILDKQDRNSEEERGATVVALGRIGDARAVEPLVNQFKASYSTVVVYWIQGALDTALRSITGERDVIGKDEWLRWSQKGVAN
jgi:HEAT repeat protein